MATTGFWPVKDRLKEVIDYADNPNKTTDKKYLDVDLYAALRYAVDDDKTDKKMYVSAINCPAKRAYERMMATKKRFGKMGGNVAYHGYQSFQTGEVTPEEAHKIGLEYGKSILKEADFYGGGKKEYWIKQKGNLSHREILKGDIDTALARSTNFKAFEIRLKDMGYEICRDERFAHYSVKAPGWQKAVRIDRFGKEYTPQAIRERMPDNQRYVGYVPFQKPKYAPLLTLEIEYNKMKRMDGIQIIFALVIELCRLIMGNNVTKDTPRPLSPAMRQEVVNLNKTLREYKFLCENYIDSPQELVSFIEERRGQISVLEKERQSIYNRNRHKKSGTLNAEAREISAKIKPLREELSLAKAVAEKIPKLKEVLETERQAEAAVLTKNKERRYAR
ncbi:MAG: relaxase/mobilization nuclease domain-containing protein [Clostridium sp.]|nr:relaxase/mobilization nuclease domain-containing protein [Clostridium sp.]